MTDELVTEIHEEVEKICYKEHGYLESPSWYDTKLVLEALLRNYTIKKEEK